MKYAAELAFAKDLARQAGDIMLRHFQIGMATNIKADDSPVTIADTAINQLVIEQVQQQYPGYSVVGEEDSRIVPGAEYAWVCDPIDGTIPYSFGLTLNVFGFTLTHNGEPVVSVVHDPYLKRLFWAVKGEGAFLDDKRLQVSQTPLSESIISTNIRTSRLVDALEFQKQVEPVSRRTANFGSSVYEGIMVAAGPLSAHLYFSAHAHDVASSKLFVEEAGGRVTSLFGEDQRYDQDVTGAVVSNGVVHDELVAIARKCMLKA